jgi:hypothetical protein
LHSNVDGLSLEVKPKLTESVDTISFCCGPEVMDVSGGQTSGPDRQRSPPMGNPAAGFWTASRIANKTAAIVATNTIGTLMCFVLTMISFLSVVKYQLLSVGISSI